MNTTYMWPPNKALEPTPLCGPKIGAILEAGFGPSVFPINRGGAAQRQGVGPPSREIAQYLCVTQYMYGRSPFQKYYDNHI